MRTTAHRNSVLTGYDLVEQDSDGIGDVLISISGAYSKNGIIVAEHAARLLTIARNMPGGWERAIELCRAETARHEGE